MAKKRKMQQKRYAGLSKAEKDWVKAQERRELIMSAIALVAMCIIIAVIIMMAGEALGV